MKKMAFVLVLSFGSVLIGYLVQRMMLKGAGDENSVRQRSISNSAKWIKLITLAGILPWPILFTFWSIESIPAGLMVIPFLGVGSLLVGGLSAFAIVRITGIAPEKAGSLFVCGMMTNLGIIGGLIGMLFFGSEGFLAVQLFTMFEVFTYYLIGFPMSQQIGRGDGTGFHFDPKLLISKPMSLLPLTAIIIGLILRGLNVPAPELLNKVSSVIVPSVTALIGFSIGLTLKVSRIRNYRREAGYIAIIKFLIIPGIIIPAAALLGLPDMLGGVAFKMVIFLSFGPVALIALVPPQLYGLDLDLANSGWLVTTVIHLLIVPLLIFILI